jgi:ATP-dependent DNA helicase RecQ
MRGNFGKNTVIDVLRGSKNARVQRFMLDKLSTYGICKESKSEIQDAINFLTINGFLQTTSSEFPVLKLGLKAGQILKDKIKVEMKVSAAKRQEQEAKEAGALANKAHEQTPQVTAIDKTLLAKLKTLRAELANAQSLPAYIIFHDSAVIDMCAKLPKNKDEFSKISGVGAQKLAKYGDIFINEINVYLNRPSA